MILLKFIFVCKEAGNCIHCEGNYKKFKLILEDDGYTKVDFNSVFQGLLDIKLMFSPVGSVLYT